MSDQIAKLFLSFSHETIILPFVILGYIWLDRKIFYHAICLVLISMLWNHALKVTFRVPMAHSVGKAGFAFPSGHMQLATVIYGWLFTKASSNVIKAILIGILIGIAYSLVHMGYHNYFDIIGALIFAALLLLVYSLFSKQNVKLQSVIVIVLASMLMIYSEFMHGIAAHLWMAYYGLIGIIISEQLFASKISTKTVPAKIIATVLCFAALSVIKLLFATGPLALLPAFIGQLQWAMIGFCITGASFVASYIAKTSRISS